MLPLRRAAGCCCEPGALLPCHCTPQETSAALQELQTAEVARLTLLAALLLPLRSCQVQDKKGKQHPVTAEVVGEGMKWPKKMASNTAALHAEAPGLLQTYKALQVRQHPCCMAFPFIGPVAGCTSACSMLGSLSSPARKARRCYCCMVHLSRLWDMHLAPEHHCVPEPASTGYPVPGMLMMLRPLDSFMLQTVHSSWCRTAYACFSFSPHSLWHAPCRI